MRLRSKLSANCTAVEEYIHNNDIIIYNIFRNVNIKLLIYKFNIEKGAAVSVLLSHFFFTLFLTNNLGGCIIYTEIIRGNIIIKG